MTTTTYNFTAAAGTNVSAITVNGVQFTFTPANATFDNLCEISSANPGTAKWHSDDNRFNFYNFGSVEHIFQLKVHALNNAACQLVVRAIDDQNHLQLALNASGVATLYKRIAGTFSTVGTFAASGMQAGWVYMLDTKSEANKVSLWADKNDGAGFVKIGASFDIPTELQVGTATRVGWGSRGVLTGVDPYVSQMSVSDDPRPQIVLTDVTANRVFQRDKGTTSKTITVAGTYVGSPAKIQARVVLAGTSTEALTWTDIVSSPSSASSSTAFSGDLTVPQGGMYNLQVRLIDGSSATLASNNGSNSWGVGLVIKTSGQSNMARMWSNSGIAIASGLSLSKVSSINTSTGLWQAGLTQSSSGIAAFASYLAYLTGIPVGLGNSAVDSTTLAQHSPGGSLWDSGTVTHEVPMLTALGGDIEALLWLQGESDLGIIATYNAGFDTYIDEHKARTGRTGKNELLVGIAPISRVSINPHGYTSGPSDGDRPALRKANADWVAAEIAASDGTNAFISHDGVTSDHIDDQHYAWAEYMRAGYKFARALAYQLGFITDYNARGPIPLSAVRAAGDIDVTFSDTLSSRTGTTSDITGFRYRLNGGSWSAVTGSITAADTVRLSIADPGSATVEIDYLGGAASGVPDLTNFLTGDKPARGAITSGASADTVMLPAEPTRTAMTAAPIVTGASSSTTEDVTATGAGTVVSPTPASGASSATLEEVAADGEGTVVAPPSIEGSSSATTEEVAAAGEGEVDAPPSVAGSSAATMEDVIASGTGVVVAIGAAQGASDATADDVTASGAGTVTEAGQVALFEVDVPAARIFESLDT